MAEYTAREWSNGDIVTASNLNQIEDGIENASSGGSELLVVGMTIEDPPSAGQTTYTLDKTWQEIDDAFPNVYVQTTINGESYKDLITEVGFNGPLYGVTVTNLQLITDSPSGYPTYVTQVSQ